MQTFIDWSGSAHPSHALPPECGLSELNVYSKKSKELNSFLKNIGISFNILQGEEDKIEAIFNCPNGLIHLV